MNALQINCEGNVTMIMILVKRHEYSVSERGGGGQREREWQTERERERDPTQPSAMSAQHSYNRWWKHISARHIGNNDSYFARYLVTDLIIQNRQHNSWWKAYFATHLTYIKTWRGRLIIYPERSHILNIKVMMWNISFFFLIKWLSNLNEFNLVFSCDFRPIPVLCKPMLTSVYVFVWGPDSDWQTQG